MIDLSDLQPKDRQIEFKGHTLTCKPLRMSHAIIVSKIGSVFQNPEKYNTKEIKQIEHDLDELIADLIPDIKGIQLSMEDTMDLISELMETNQPKEAEELNKANVQFDNEKKVAGDGTK